MNDSAFKIHAQVIKMKNDENKFKTMKTMLI